MLRGRDRDVEGAHRLMVVQQRGKRGGRRQRCWRVPPLPQPAWVASLPQDTVVGHGSALKMMRNDDFENRCLLHSDIIPYTHITTPERDKLRPLCMRVCVWVCGCVGGVSEREKGQGAVPDSTRQRQRTRHRPGLTLTWGCTQVREKCPSHTPADSVRLDRATIHRSGDPEKTPVTCVEPVMAPIRLQEMV